MNRRDFLRNSALAGLAWGLPPGGLNSAQAAPARPAAVKPARLKPGDTVALVSPSGATATRFEVTIVKENMEALGFKVKFGEHLLDRYGYLGGKDEDRAADLMNQFADPEVAGVVAMRGGWGCARMLPFLDYDIIRKNPKILIGYSDITALLISIYAKTGLVTFHGPIGLDAWNSFTVGYFRRIVMDGEAVTMQNQVDSADRLTPRENRVQTIVPGTASGILKGGCLSIVSSLLGTEYVPPWKDAILFVEDINEEIYRVDRMLTHLKLAGVLAQAKGFIFGSCTECGPGEGYGALTLEQVLDDHIKPLGIPSWFGSMIGHISMKFTVPVGVEAQVDAAKGTIQLLVPAVG
jgi:muramoyltetrapeptide carboxypeptidase